MMALLNNSIPADIRQFIFEHIDSVEQLEILLLLRSKPNQPFSEQTISQELRTSVKSVAQRLNLLTRAGFIQCEEANPKIYQYIFGDPQFDDLLRRVEEVYRTHKHSMYELIFSPLKRARTFADAFKVKKEGDDHG